jgi:5-bromo-4-chloroindolyl phosphate hydrolysis protein
VLLFSRRRTIDRVDPNRVGQAQAELVASLIEDGETVIARLKLAAQKLQSKDAASKAGHMAEIARSILDRLAEEPDKLSAVRRFLTYYMPRSAEIAEGMVVVETQRSPDRKRLGEIADIMGKLDHAFTFYSDSFAQAELDTLDVELRLLSRSLTEDVAPAAAEIRSTNERAS